MTTYRWAVVLPSGYVVENILEISPMWAKKVLFRTQDWKPEHEKRWRELKAEGYTVKKFKLVECAEGEGE